MCVCFCDFRHSTLHAIHFGNSVRTKNRKRVVWQLLISIANISTFSLGTHSLCGRKPTNIFININIEGVCVCVCAFTLWPFIYVRLSFAIRHSVDTEKECVCVWEAECLVSKRNSWALQKGSPHQCSHICAVHQIHTHTQMLHVHARTSMSLMNVQLYKHVEMGREMWWRNNMMKVNT